MVDLSHLLPQEAPELLTARQGTQHLQEHFLGFLNANNCTGFTAEEVSSTGENAIIVTVVIGFSPDHVFWLSVSIFPSRMKAALAVI